MSTIEIARLPVKDVSANPSHLYLWVTASFIQEGLFVMEQWGFTYKTMGFWVKTAKNGSPHIGGGHYLRQCGEPFLFGVRGKLTGLDRSCRNVILAPRQKDSGSGKAHSRKPDELYSIIERNSPGRRLELFARRKRRGWTGWGNQL
jgi:N6-adenosine-specific RNA methylase IME4